MTTNNFSFTKLQAITHTTGSMLAIAVVILFVSHTHIAFAATNDQITLATNSDGNYSVTIPENLKTQWKGSYTVPQLSLVRYNQKPIAELVATALGRGEDETASNQTYNYNPAAIYQSLSQFSAQINSELHEGSLTVDQTTKRATAFTPPTPGRNLNLYESTKNVLASLDKNELNVPLSVESIEPGPLADTGKLGITELIGHGVSTFSGSPHNRRVNIAKGVEKMKGIIIAKGQEFSFNQYLGPVEASTGFLPELVIKAEGTVPEFGGGLCQVSSTTFRAAMEAGLPITQRKNHSYAVSYYAPQGTDATIYPGVIDLKFVNDTPGSILVWPYFKDDNTLIFDFYGTKDDRQVTLEKPLQYDRKSDGSMKASWTRTMVKEGKSTTQTFYSNYQPPALFHKQEKFPTAPAPTDTVPPSTPPAETTTPTTPTTTPPTNSNTTPPTNS